MIRSGEKKEEYREIKPYYTNRLLRYFDIVIFTKDSPDTKRSVIFRNGYSKKSPQIKCLCSLDIGLGLNKWGAVSGKEYYILKIIEVYEEE